MEGEGLGVRSKKSTAKHRALINYLTLPSPSKVEGISMWKIVTKIEKPLNICFPSPYGRGGAGGEVKKSTAKRRALINYLTLPSPSKGEGVSM